VSTDGEGASSKEEVESAERDSTGMEKMTREKGRRGR
jgi:hypothetical protein